MATPANVPVKSIRVGHLGGTSIGYQLPKPIVGSKPTIIFVGGWGAPASLMKPQISSPELQAAANLLLLEPLGQGISKTNSPAWTAWDSAYAFIQAMDALGVKKAFVLGCSQAGWIAARMALYAPDRILGIIPICSIMDSYGPRLIELGVPDVVANMTPVLSHLTAESNNDFALPAEFSNSFYDGVVGPNAGDAEKEALKPIAEAQLKTYEGEAGRLKLRQSVKALLTHDSLLSRLEDIIAPVLWIAGSNDPLVSEKAARADAALFKSNVDFLLIDGAFHFPTWTHAEQVHTPLLAFVKKYGGVKDARALREAVGMVDI